MTATAPPCVSHPEAFWDESLSELPSAQHVDRHTAAKRAAVHRTCAGCPVLVDCLYHAVVEVDVAGFAACTTEAERAEIRRRLDIQVSTPAFGPAGSPRVGGGPVSHEAVVMTRQAHPQDTCAQLADRLGCSVSTIKRHLRRARQEHAEPQPAAPTAGPPTVDEVLEAFESLESARVA